MKRILALLALAPLSALALVNVNTAQQSELAKTRGLDRYKAKSIIEWRAANGPIDSIAQLEKVPGITPEVAERVAPEIAFQGPPYKPSKPAATSKEKSKEKG